MNNYNIDSISPAVSKRLLPFIEGLKGAEGENLQSVTVVGSAATPDYIEKLSDINTVVVMNEIDVGSLSRLAPLGKKFGSKGIAAPLVLTPGHIRDSLDSFPMEFYDFKLIHRTVYGPDPFNDLSISDRHLRLQCEREIKSRLLGLRQGFLSSLGRKALLVPVLVRSITGSMPLFRAVIHLMGKEPPIPRPEVVKALRAAAGIDADVFEYALALKARIIKPSGPELSAVFERYYRATEAMGKIVDELRS